MDGNTQQEYIVSMLQLNDLIISNDIQNHIISSWVQENYLFTVYALKISNVINRFIFVGCVEEICVF